MNKEKHGSRGIKDKETRKLVDIFGFLYITIIALQK